MADRIQLILASESPRRLALLTQIGIVPDRVCPAEIDEAVLPGELPRDHAARLAEQKAHAIASKRSDLSSNALILAADTVVACGRRILPKAQTAEDAQDCLTLLSGRAHQVYTGVAVISQNGPLRHKVVRSKVRFKVLSDEESQTYIASEEWRGKAGGYAIQGRAAAFVKSINGSYSNIVGLPLYEVVQLLAGSGYR